HLMRYCFFLHHATRSHVLSTLSLHDALPIYLDGDWLGLTAFAGTSYILSPLSVDGSALTLYLDVRIQSVEVERERGAVHLQGRQDRKSTRLNSSLVEISYAVFCLKKKKRIYV